MKLQAKGKKKGALWTRAKMVAVGVDISTYSISMAGTAYLANGKKRTGRAISHRWEKDDDYFLRLKEVANAHNFVHDLLTALRVDAEVGDLCFAVEEAVSFGHIQRGMSNSIKQQLQISGSFLGGLLRYGYKNIYEIQANSWRKVVADDLGITIHHTKWGKGAEGKYRVQEWVEKFHPKWDGHWPDMISTTKRGLIPRPETSRAKGVQPDDRYAALAIMQWMDNQLEELPF